MKTPSHPGKRLLRTLAGTSFYRGNSAAALRNEQIQFPPNLPGACGTAIKCGKSMLDCPPSVREKPLSVMASLLACIIFTALLAAPGAAMGREDKNLS